MEASPQTERELTSEEQAIFERLGPLFDEERVLVAKALANGDLFGEKEYEIRDRVHRLGAQALEVAADERQKKGGIRGC